MQVWLVPLDIDDKLAQDASLLLGAPQLKRSLQMPDPRVRRRYVAAHAAMRQILGQATGCHPSQVDIQTGVHGKPCLAGGPAFNLSHSGSLALVALDERPGAEVGVDLELLPLGTTVDPDILHVFSRAERAAIAATPLPTRSLATLRCWTRKEALLKAAGCGLDEDTRAFSVSLGAEAALLASSHPRLAEGEWSLAALESPQHWTGAIATRGTLPATHLLHWEWPA